MYLVPRCFSKWHMSCLQECERSPTYYAIAPMSLAHVGVRVHVRHVQAASARPRNAGWPPSLGGFKRSSCRLCSGFTVSLVACNYRSWSNLQTHVFYYFITWFSNMQWYCWFLSLSYNSSSVRFPVLPSTCSVVCCSHPSFELCSAASVLYRVSSGSVFCCKFEISYIDMQIS